MASRIVFAADTQQFNDPVKRSANEVRALQAELRKMEQTAKQSFQEQRLAARAAGASTEELRKLDQAYAREQVALNTTRKQVTAESIAGSREQVSGEQAKLRAIELTTKALERQRAAAAAIPQASQHSEVTDRQKASAIVRGASGTASIRAGESILTQIPGFAAAAGPLFEAAGIAALTVDLVRGIEKIIEFRKEAQEATQRLRDGFASANAPIETSADNLRKANAELEISIARLEHRPANTLKLELAETALELDRIADRARGAYQEIKKLLKENRVGFFESFATGKGNTAEVSNLAEGGFRDIENLSADQKDAQNKYGANSAQAKAAAKALKDRRDRLGSDLSDYLSKINGTEEVNQTGAYGVQTKVRLSYEQAHGDQTDNRQIVRGAQRMLGGQDDEDSQLVENKSLTSKDKNLKSANQLAKEGLEAAKQAAAAQRKQWDDDHQAWENEGDRSTQDEVNFWLERVNTTKRGSENYNEASKKANEQIKRLNQERRKAFDEGLKLQRELANMTAAALNGGALERTGNAYAKGQGDAAKSGSDLRDQQEDAARAIALSNVQFDLQAGRISKADAAVQTATIHTMQYEAQVRRLKEAYDAIQAGPNADAQRNDINKQYTGLQDQRQVQVMQDGANTAATSWLDALRRTNALWVQDSQDSAKQIAQLYGTILDGVNSDLTTVIQHVGERGYHHNGRDLRNALAGTARGVGGQVLNAGLRRAESGVLGAFGLGGKADGSKQNPFNVFVTNGVDGKTQGSLLPSSASIRNLMPGGSDTNGFTNSFAGAALSFLPGGSLLSGLFGGARAMGGGVDTGKAYLVGENGPELFSPGATGYVSTADRTRSMMSGHTFNIGDIDARGAHDPAAVRAQVQQGIMEAAPHIVAASLAAGKDQRSRVPTSMRG